MLQMMIVDDYRIDRENIKDCLDWRQLGINISLEAQNGKEALAMLEDNIVDLILTDVQMPFLNGIELAQKVASTYPNIKIVFMSYYNDFNYLKSAIDLSANGYIIKPFVEEEVEDTFRKVIKRIETQNRLKKLLGESKPLLENKFYMNLLNGGLASSDEIIARAKYLNVDIKDGYFQAIYIDVSNDIDNENIEQVLLSNIKFDEVLKKYCSKYSVTSIVNIDENKYIVLLNKQTYQDIISLSYDFVENINDIIARKKRMTIGVSSIKQGVMSIAKLYKESEYALKYKFYYEKENIINYEDVSDSAVTPELDVNNIQKSIKMLISNGNIEDIENYIDTLFENIIITGDSAYNKTIFFAVLMSVQIALNDINSEFDLIHDMMKENRLRSVVEFKTVSQLKKWLVDMINNANGYVNNIKESKKYKLIIDIKDFIYNNFQSDITVKEISEQFHYSPNYLNMLFRNNIGKSIHDFLTDVRVEKAKELLMQSELKIYEIIDQIGYKKASHFNNVFKSKTGLTPSAYRGKA